MALRYYDDLLARGAHDPDLAEEMAADASRGSARLKNLMGERAAPWKSHRKALALRRDPGPRTPAERRIRRRPGRDPARHRHPAWAGRISATRRSWPTGSPGRSAGTGRADPACRLFLESASPPALEP